MMPDNVKTPSITAPKSAWVIFLGEGIHELYSLLLALSCYIFIHSDLSCWLQFAASHTDSMASPELVLGLEYFEYIQYDIYASCTSTVRNLNWLFSVKANRDSCNCCCSYIRLRWVSRLWPTRHGEVTDRSSVLVLPGEVTYFLIVHGHASDWWLVTQIEYIWVCDKRWVDRILFLMRSQNQSWSWVSSLFILVRVKLSKFRLYAKYISQVRYLGCFIAL